VSELDKLEKNMVEKIKEHGWFAMSVAPAVDSDDPEEWFTYTIGLPHTFGWPELICFGLNKETAYALLSDAIDECKSKGQIPVEGMILTDVIEGWPAKLIGGGRIPDNYFGSARWFARYIGTEDPPERLQLLWPDKQGVFPDEPGCVEGVVLDQTPVETS
jgi:Domain of unknown function (DUF4262)